MDGENFLHSRNIPLSVMRKNLPDDYTMDGNNLPLSIIVRAKAHNTLFSLTPRLSVGLNTQLYLWTLVLNKIYTEQ